MLNCVSQALHAATDQLSAGFIICGAGGRIFHANCAAAEMMEAGWPVRRYNQDYIRVSDRGRHEALLNGLRHIASSAHDDQLSLEIPLAPARSVCGAALATLRPLFMEEQRLMSVFITVTGKNNSMGVSGFAACFGLTPAETRTLQQVMNGLSPMEAAVVLKVSHNTTKTHLRNIFAKTRTSRQPDLVQLFARLTPPLRRSHGSTPDRTRLSGFSPSSRASDSTLMRHP